MSEKSAFPYTPLYWALKNLAVTLDEALAAKNLSTEIEGDGIEPCCWLRKEINTPPEAGKCLVSYPVRGGSEGYWVHVDLMYRMGRIDNVERAGVHFCETVMLAKSFAGFAIAAEIAKVINERLDELEPMVIKVFDALETIGKV
jgi:hypothetical protein